MAAKFEAEVSARRDVQLQKMMTETPTQPESWEICSEIPVSSREIEKLEELCEFCHQVFCYIRSASNESKPTKILDLLKDAKELALKALKSCHLPT